jgi:hypothetical protein
MERLKAHWSVNVSMNGESLVTIESNCLSGKPEFTEAEAQVIRDAATHLKAFIGEPKPLICECSRYEGVNAPYPSGICPDCGRWYPGKKLSLDRMAR